MTLLGEDTYTRRRYDGSAWVAGRWVQAASVDASFSASMQVLTGRNRQVSVEGLRIRADRYFLMEALGFLRSDDQVTGVEADEIVVGSETFVVVHFDDAHRLIPHNVAYAVRKRESSPLAAAGLKFEVEAGLRNWIVATAAAGGIPAPDSSVIFADENGPRPPLPYLVLDIQVFDERIGTDSQRSNALGQVEVRGLRRGSVSVLAYGEGSVPWLERATTLLTSPAARAILDTAGLEVKSAGGLVDLTQVVDIEEEGRHQRDFDLLYVREPRTGEAEQGTILTEVQHTDTWDSNQPTDLVVNSTIDMTSP